MGKILVIFTLLSAVLVGGAVYYLQVYAYYEEVVATGTDDVMLTRLDTGQPEAIPYAEFQAIDATSSPIRYRGCFTTQASTVSLSQAYAAYPDARPIEGPRWFGCYDADEIGDALESGQAQAFLSIENVHYGVDRVVALFGDGRGFVWHQINHCGEVVFDGRPAPEGCPPPPEGIARQ